MKYEVQIINAGSYGPVAEAVIIDGGSMEKTFDLPSLIFALKDEKGEVVICDASFGDPEVSTRVMASTPYPVTVRRDTPLPELMRKNGIDPEAVKTVILSHHHWDHAGGVYAFPNAKVYIQKSEWEFAETDANYGPEFKAELDSFRERLFLIDGNDNTTFPGIEMVLVGGHSEGSQMLFVDTKEGIVCLAFDVIMSQRNIDEKRPIGLAYNPAQAAEALKMVLERNCKVYFGHEIPVQQD